ncbi:MAG: alanyl-tRNA editing protein [Armatimonadetes bacterium]|nr:alanyl-tRNA editing protein [Armatimonadota bacterium]
MTEEIFREDCYARSCAARVIAVDADGIRLDRTVFYPTGGGQPGDVGVLRHADGRTVRISNTRKGDGEIIHVPEPDQPTLSEGEEVTAEIDWERRYRLMRMHTCLHVLCAIVPGAVTGGQVGDGKGRLDFDCPETLDAQQITASLQRLVGENHPAHIRWITDEEMEARPDLVRTMSVKPPSGAGRVRLLDIEGIDLQPCGGTHLRATGEIGAVEVKKIEKKGARNRRVVVGFVE